MLEDPANARIVVSLPRKCAFWVLSGIFRLLHFTLRRSSPNPLPLHSAIIIEPFGMGDAISIQPAVRFLLHKGYSVTVASRLPWKSLFADSPIKWFSIPKPWSNFGTTQYLGFVLNLLRDGKSMVRPAIGIDPRGDIRSLIVLAAMGCERIVTFDHYVGFDVSLNLPGVKTIPDRFSQMKKWQGNVELVATAVSALPVYRPPDLAHLVSPDSSPSDKKKIGLIPVAPWIGKSWPSESWKELSSVLEASGFFPVILTGPGQLAEANRQVDLPSIPAIESETLAEFAENLNSCQLIVSVDTGPMHLASALGIPVIGLFGSGQVPLWAPVGENYRVVSPTASRLPAIHQIPGNAALGVEGMRRIAVADVLRAVNELLEWPSPRPPKL